METELNTTGGTPAPKSRNNMIRLAALFTVLLAVAAAIAVYLLSRGESPRQFYFDAESRNFKNYADRIKQTYRDFYAGQKPYFDQTYKKRYEITADIKSENDKMFGFSNAGAIFDVIGRCKLIIDSNQNPAAAESLTKLLLTLEKAPMIDAVIYTKNKELGFTVPVLLPDKYAALDIDRIDDIYERFDIPIRPKRIAGMIAAAKTLKYSDEEFDSVVKDYGSYIASFIDESDVKFGKNVGIKTDGIEKTGREVIVSLGNEKTRKLLQDITGKISRDSLLLKLTYENYADLAKILDDAGFFRLLDFLDKNGYLNLNDILKNFINGLNVKKDTEGLKRTVGNVFENASFPDGMNMTLVIDGSGNILDRKFSIACLKNDGEKTAVNIHTGNSGIKSDAYKNGFCTIDIESTQPGGKRYGDSWSIRTRFPPGQKNGEEKGEINIGYIKKANDRNEFKVQLKLDTNSYKEDALKKRSIVMYDAQFTGIDPDITDSFKGEINTVSWKNNKYKTRNSSTSITLNMELPSFDVKKTSLKFELVREDRFGTDFSLPQVDAGNTINLNNVTDKDLSVIQGEIMKSFADFYLKNKPVIDAISGK